MITRVPGATRATLIALTLVLERCWFWAKTHGPAAQRRLDQASKLLRAGEIQRAQDLFAGDSGIYGRLIQDLIAGAVTEATAVEAVERQRCRLRRFMPTLGTVITAAPMFGTCNVPVTAPPSCEKTAVTSLGPSGACTSSVQLPLTSTWAEAGSVIARRATTERLTALARAVIGAPLFTRFVSRIGCRIMVRESAINSWACGERLGYFLP